MRTIFFCLFLFSVFPLFSQNSTSGFRGWDWGTSILNVSDQLERSDHKITGYKSFRRKGDCKTFEGIQTGEVLYLFKKERLVGVLIYIQPNDFERMGEILNQEYGIPKKMSSDKIDKHLWMANGTMVEMIKVSVNPRVEQISIRIFPPNENG